MNLEYVTLDAARNSAKDECGKKLDPAMPEVRLNLEDLAFDIHRSPISPIALEEFIKALKG